MKAKACPAPVRVSVRDLQSRVGIDPARARRAVREVLAGERVKGPAEVTVCFLTDRRIRGLNREFHGRDSATDVLAFDLGAPGALLADIAISTDTAVSNAKRFGTSPRYESYLYLVHGTLHLAGYDDSSPRSAAKMREREAHYLKKLKITWQ